jgi:hypothetical protein
MATYKHLRSSTANKRPTTSITDGQLAINTNTASPGLFFKDSAGTGIVKVGPVHVGTTAPNATPAAGGSAGNYTGEQWLDTSVSPAQMKVWNGSAWVGIVADELPVSKLQDGAARQLLQTDAAGTGVEWTSNVDVPGTLDVTGATTLDSTLTVPLGSAASPTLRFSGDANSGLYSPGADQVAISTGGTGRLFVDASGRMRIGSGGQMWINQTANISGTGNSVLLQATATGPDYTCAFANSNAAPYGIYLQYSTDVNTDGNSFVLCQGLGVTRVDLRSNGGIANYQANNVNLSDINTKTNISPAAGTWDCIKEWEIVNYRYKDQPDDADLNLGVIAQQVAESCPEVITVFQEAKDDQPEKLGVKEQQMYWMAIKALQEAQVRIEQLEQRLNDAGIN